MRNLSYLRFPAGILLAASVQAAPLPSPPQAFQLPSGLRCFLLENHDQPHLRCELVTRWGPSEEPAAKKGLAGFLAALMRTGGAGPYTQPDFNRALDDLGIELGFEAQRNAYRWTLATDSRSQEPALELMATAVFRPVFDVAQVAAHRQWLIKQATGVAVRQLALNQYLWNLRDPGTEPPPTLEGLQSVEYADLEAFRRRVVRPETSTLVLYGDLNLTQAKELVLLHFGLWGPGAKVKASEPAAGAAPVPEAGPGARCLASLDTRPEAEVWAGREPGLCPKAVEELLGLLLEQVPQGVAPGVTRTCSLGCASPLLLKVEAGPGGRGGLLEAMKGTLDALRTRGFTDLEVERARLRWKARMTALPLHPQEELHRFTQGVLDPAFRAQVEAVTAKEINGALKAMLEPGALRFLLLGGDDRLVQGAESAGLGPVSLVKVRN